MQCDTSVLLEVIQIHLTPRLFPRLPDACGFGAVVGDAFFEPGVLEGLFGGDALLGVVLEDASEEVDELFVEAGGCRDDFL